MLSNWFPKFRFRLKSVFILILGIAIGYSLNLQTLRLLTGASSEAYMGSLPAYIIEPPDILSIELPDKDSKAPPLIAGQYLVGPDGKINLGIYGQVFVAGKTIDEVSLSVKESVSQLETDFGHVLVDVIAFNSKVYYIVQQGQSKGDSVARVPITGNETVLDAVAQIGGIKTPDTTNIWIARPSSNGAGSEKILPINWDKIAGGVAMTNYQLLPGDRVFIRQNPNNSTATN